MLPKLICAAAIASGGAFAHSAQTRDTNPVYRKVNRDSEYGAPAAPAYNAPAPSYGAPAPSYAAPAPSYSAPAPSYAAPAPSYAEPSYEEPSASYGQPSYAADDGGGIDLTALIIPILALIGLSLLFPTYVSVASRKKRSLPDGTDVVGEFGSDLILLIAQRTFIYIAAVAKSGATQLHTTLHYNTRSCQFSGYINTITQPYTHTHIHTHKHTGKFFYFLSSILR